MTSSAILLNNDDNSFNKKDKSSKHDIRSVIVLRPNKTNPISFEISSIYANFQSKKYVESAVNDKNSKHNIPLILFNVIAYSVLEINHLHPWIKKDDLIVLLTSDYLKYNKFVTINYNGGKFNVIVDISSIYENEEHCLQITISDDNVSKDIFLKDNQDQAYLDNLNNVELSNSKTSESIVYFYSLH